MAVGEWISDICTAEKNERSGSNSFDCGRKKSETSSAVVHYDGRWAGEDSVEDDVDGELDFCVSR